ncbi:hypothetical protein DY000_02059564 [Brassica cretica]|uniref:Protein RFT1 homolog n=1 Tax=Brassica cretica TaxID=69181 RepID=A0ABQ7AQM4_BRACR|nr:hypothetical protein DY000_02059564 [Brassica cretica]
MVLAVRGVFTGSEIVFSIVIVYRHGLHSGAVTALDRFIRPVTSAKIFGSDVVDRSLCLSSALASLSNLVKLIYLSAGVKVVRPSLATAIHTQQQLLNLLYSLVPCSHLSNVVMDSKMEKMDGFIFLVQSMVLCHLCQARVVVIVQKTQQVQMLDKFKV